MRYIAKKTEVINPKINSPEWEKAEAVTLTTRWGMTAPETTAKLLRGPEGISVLLNSKETELRMECKEENGWVCRDSCMEFFFKPDPWDTRYFNFEVNPKGVMHLGFGSGRHGRVPVEVRDCFDIETIPESGNWSVKIYIPDAFVLTYVEHIGKVCKGNFYKCGDYTVHEHYASWCNPEVPEPDYHQPDFFGFIVL